MSGSAFALESNQVSPRLVKVPTAQQPMPPLAQKSHTHIIRPNLIQSLTVSVIDPIITGPVPAKK
ncbi:hypothetical protein ACLBWZ_12115 [Brucellaceae bacterium C25G]